MQASSRIAVIDLQPLGLVERAGLGKAALDAGFELLSNGSNFVLRQQQPRLALSLYSANTHLRNCHAKLQARNRQQALNRARRSGQMA